MDARKKKALEAKGWKSVTVTDFLGLTPEEEAYIELKLILIERLKERRREMHLTQVQLARKIHSDQSRVAKMEANDPSVSADFMFKTLFAMGVTPREVGKALAIA